MLRIVPTALAAVLCTTAPALAGFSLNGVSDKSQPAPAAAPEVPSGFAYHAPLGERSITSTLPPVPVYGGAVPWTDPGAAAAPAGVSSAPSAPIGAYPVETHSLPGSNVAGTAVPVQPAPAPMATAAAPMPQQAQAFSGLNDNPALTQPMASEPMASVPMTAVVPMGSSLPVVGVGPVNSGGVIYPVEEDDFAVYFDFNLATLTPESADSLLRWAAFLTFSPATKITVEGFADDIGGNHGNMTLSQRRADTVRNFLISQGIAPQRIATTPYGEERPAIDPFYTIRPNGAYSRISRAYNRRAVIEISGSTNPDWISYAPNWQRNRTGR